MQEKLTSENIALLKKMIRELNWGIAILLIILVVVDIFLFYTNISNKITFIILCDLGLITICFVFIKEQKAIKQDIKNNVKSIINGTITRITSIKGKSYVYIGEVSYVVPQQRYKELNIGDDIKIEISPICKHIINITKIKK